MTKDQKVIKAAMLKALTIDKVVCHRDGTVSVKHGYFYRHGNTAAKWAAEVVKELADVGVKVSLVSAADEWRAWPKDSYFVAKVAKSICRHCPMCGSDAVWPEFYSEFDYPLDCDWTVASLLGSWECECGWTGYEPNIDILDSTVPYYKKVA